MSKRKTEYLKFLINDREKFLVEVDKLSTRAKNLLKNEDIDSYDSFYYRLLIKNSLTDFRHHRNSGSITQNELINLVRAIFNSDGRYNEEIEIFDAALYKLSPKARRILEYLGLTLFETFYYKYAILKEAVDFKKTHNTGPKTQPELNAFVESVCDSIGIEMPYQIPKVLFNPKNSRIPFIPHRLTKKKFFDGFNNLSPDSRIKLSKWGADSLDGFYLEIISEKSQFNMFLNNIGEQNLLEILKLKTEIADSINEIKK